jgi:CubicO group peptidase (beta-lactamase class C family)
MLRIAFSLIALVWCNMAPAAPLDLEPLLAAIEQQRIAHRVAGVGLTIVSAHRVLWTGGFGVNDWAKREPVGADTLFRIGSITKVFTAATALVLEQEGRLRLDDPVRRYVPSPPYRNDWERTAPVTIAQLLEHTAGFQDLTKEEFDSSDPTPLTLEQGFAIRPDAHFTRWKPGLHSVYSNFGYGLAGLVIQRVSGRRYEDEVMAKLIEPLGMASSGFFLDDAARARLATGYDTDGRTPIRYWHMIFRPFGGLNSTARDMGALVQLLLNRGRHGGRQVLSAEALERMETPRTSLAARNGLTFGYGLGVNQSYWRGVLFYGHAGDGDGYLARFGYNRESGLGYFVVINAFDHDALRALRAEVEGAIVRTLPPRDPAPAAQVPADTLKRYVGDYELAAWRMPWTTPEQAHTDGLRVLMIDSVLYTQAADGTRAALIPVTERHFRREGEPAATSAFVEDEDGELYLEEDESYRLRRR